MIAPPFTTNFVDVVSLSPITLITEIIDSTSFDEIKPLLPSTLSIVKDPPSFIINMASSPFQEELGIIDLLFKSNTTSLVMTILSLIST